LQLQNDIAMLRLKTPVGGLGSVRLATEADMMDVSPGAMARVIGWGYTEGVPAGAPPFPDRLRQADVPIRPEAGCESVYGDNFNPAVHLCAGYKNVETDACHGDSGGPLFLVDGDSFLHIGIVSWGYGCADGRNYGVYARTAAFTDWVEEITGVTSGAEETCNGLEVTIGPDAAGVAVTTPSAASVARTGCTETPGVTPSSEGRPAT
jgi:secreted trypsin-like serine protease